MKRIVTLGLGLFLSLSSFAAETWVNNSIGSAPVFAGYESTKAVYVCRASGIVGKYIAADRKCYIGYYGKEMAYTSFQVLQDPARQMRWVYMNNAQDSRLVFGGWENGLGLRICRVSTANGHEVGKLVPGDEPYYIIRGGKCYYGYYGKEYMSTHFDVLTY